MAGSAVIGIDYKVRVHARTQLGVSGRHVRFVPDVSDWSALPRSGRARSHEAARTHEEDASLYGEWVSGAWGVAHRMQ